MHLLGICGAMRTTPTVAIEFLLNILPLHIFVEKTAKFTACKLIVATEWLSVGKRLGHRKIVDQFRFDYICHAFGCYQKKLCV
jgi:hypothetical protein